MFRILLATAVALAVVSSTQPTFAKLAANKLAANKLAANMLSANGPSLNGPSLNGPYINTVSAHSGVGSVDDVTSVVLPSGEVIRH